MRALWLPAVFALLCACGGPPPKEPPQSASSPAPAKPVDESRRFPLAGQISMQLLTDHVLGKEFLPGGNVGEYRRAGKRFQQFLVRSPSAEAAALLLFDFKGHLRDAKYLPHMGGYFGMDGAAPIYIFQKGVFLAGFAGLPEKEADLLARQFAARLN
jgi:hypothetical protein